jgi:hypothetical protein
MTTESNQEQPAPQGSPISREQCAGCGATLVEDQRYCLQCGTRRGEARLDFTVFWAPLSPTDGASEHFDVPSGMSPSRRVVGVLAAGVLAVGILAGAALGPGPASSPADSAALAQRALGGLVARADSNAQAPSSTSAATVAPPSVNETTPTSAPAPTPTDHDDKAKSTSHATSGEASGGSSESSTSSEPSTSGASEGAASEGSSKSSKGSGESEQAAPGTPTVLPPIKHVWLIALAGESLAGAIARSQADPYLAKQLVPKGTLLGDYTLSASSELANGIALLSGQGVNLDTEQNCPTYVEVAPPTIDAANGLAEGVGCVYPHEVQTLADELTAGGLTWKAYVQNMEEGAPDSGSTGTAGSSASATGNLASGATGQSSTTSAATPTSTSPPSTRTVTCRHPELGGTDPNQAPAPGDPYQTARNPFVYFHSLLDGGACSSNDVELGQLQSDLATPASTPSLSWIVPSACDDGTIAPCAPGAAAGLTAADDFLEEIVPRILATNAYRKEGLIVIVPDSAPSSSARGAAKPVGALLLSPFVRGGARVSESFDDFSLSKSLARLFGVLPLGHANDPSTVSFGATVYGADGKAAGAASTAKKAAQAASTTQPRQRPTPDPLDLGSVVSLPGG